jgi:hypothetical protein
MVALVVLASIYGGRANPQFTLDRVLTAAIIVAIVMGACLALCVAHWRAGDQPNRRLTIFSALMAGLLAGLTAATFAGALPWLEAGEERRAALVTGLLALLYAAYAWLGWELMRRQPRAPAAGAPEPDDLPA